jgi:hypothetical protein
MRGSFVLQAAVLLMGAPAALPAQDPAPLGRIDLGIKLGYVVFSQGVTEDDGLYLGLSGYGRVAANVYVGAEVAGASTITLFTDEMTLMPLELNAKYARAVGSHVVVTGGAGASYSRAEFHDESVIGPNAVYEEWLFGGQAFGDLVFRFAWFQIGINAKYQLIQDFAQVPADFSNLRLGLQAGVIF